jgi:hypothetical protein
MPAVHETDTASTLVAAVDPDHDGSDGHVAAMLSRLRSQGDQAVAAMGRPPLQPERQQQQLMALDDMLLRIKRCFRVSTCRNTNSGALAADAVDRAPVGFSCGTSKHEQVCMPLQMEQAARCAAEARLAAVVAEHTALQARVAAEAAANARQALLLVDAQVGMRINR